MTASLPILVYHSISDEASTAFRPYTVSPQRFADHLSVMRDDGYVGLTLSDAANRLFGGGALPDRAVVLTFDDAFEDFIDFALPVMKANDFVGTMFVPSGYVGSTSRWLVAEGEERRPIMSWTQLADLAEAGIEIGAHSHTHPQLDRLSVRALRDELARPKHVLEDRLGRDVMAFAYPFGFHSLRVRRLARTVGYSVGCAVGNLTATSESSRWAIPRLTVKDTADIEALRRLLTLNTTRLDRSVSETKRVVWRLWRRAVHRDLRTYDGS